MTQPGEPLRFLRELPETDDCIPWPFGTTGDGYGALKYEGRMDLAHRVAFVLHRGPITDETLDHDCHTQDTDCPGGLCAHRRCVNPRHLVPMSLQQNGRLARRNPHTRHKTHCPKGHPYEGPNLYLTPDGRRDCRTCMRDRNRAAQRRYRARQRQEVSA